LESIGWLKEFLAKFAARRICSEESKSVPSKSKMNPIELVVLIRQLKTHPCVFL
jgi:hypothetical protein